MNRDHDHEEKRAQYEAREIPEYWGLNPQEQTVAVLRLQGDAYQEAVF